MEADRTITTASRRVLLSAFGINYGGGLVLLTSLLPALRGSLRVAVLDSRVRTRALVSDPEVSVSYVRPSMAARLYSLWRLAGIAKKGEVLFCFNSLPPLRRSRARVINYVHAPHFIGAHRGVRYRPVTALRIVIERAWFRLGVRNCDEVWAQTPTMVAALRAAYPSVEVREVPFVDDELLAQIRSRDTPPSPATLPNDGSQYTFFYAADSVGHKNHVTLLAAWRELARAGFAPKLLLTLEAGELRDMERRVPGAAGTPTPNVSALGRLSRAEVLERTRACSAVIFPSVAETFGIPMLEAQALGIPLLAGERDFVRDVCTPHETFDPSSARSIAAAVRRFMQQPEPREKMSSAQDVVARLLS
jgi:glycosyltransferase involved in cell wall biosynthesis